MQLWIAAGLVNTSRVPFHAELTRADLARVLEFRQDYDLRRGDELAARQRTHAEMYEAMQQRMAEMLGADVAFDLQRFKRSLRHRDALRQATEGRVDTVTAATVRARELVDYLENEGIDRTTLDVMTTEIRDIFTPFPLPGTSGKTVPMLP